MSQKQPSFKTLSKANQNILKCEAAIDSLGKTIKDAKSFLKREGLLTADFAKMVEAIEQIDNAATDIIDTKVNELEKQREEEDRLGECEYEEEEEEEEERPRPKQKRAKAKAEPIAAKTTKVI